MSSDQVTSSVPVPVSVWPPPLPVTVIVYGPPTGVLGDVEMVSVVVAWPLLLTATDDELKLALVRGGSPLTLKLTVPEKPLTEAIVIP